MGGVLAWADTVEGAVLRGRTEQQPRGSRQEVCNSSRFQGFGCRALLHASCREQVPEGPRSMGPTGRQRRTCHGAPLLAL